MRRSHPFIVALLIFSGLSAVLAAEPDAKLEVALRKPLDKAEIAIEEGRALIAIKSASGIGGAEIKLAAGKWPKTLVLSLALKDLEGFHAENGVLRIQIGLARAKPEVSLRAPGGDWKEAPAEDRHRISVKRVADRIEVELPAVLFADSPPAFRVQWIDFYR